MSRPGDLNNLNPLTGGQGVGGFIVLSAIAAPIYFIAQIGWWSVAIAGFLIVLVGVGYGVYAHEEWSSNKARRKAAIIERAESQHARLMDGDDSALFGDYPPADLS